MFFVARQRDVVLGCAGLRLLPGRVGEVKGSSLLQPPEAAGSAPDSWASWNTSLASMACQFCAWTPATTSHLANPAGLYAALGYEEVPAFNHGRYAEHWFAKSLT